MGSPFGTVNIDLLRPDVHYTKITLCNDLPVVFSNLPLPNRQMEFEIEFVQDATGKHNVIWPISVIKQPQIRQEPNAVSIIFFTVRNGKNVSACNIKLKKWWQFWKGEKVN